MKRSIKSYIQLFSALFIVLIFFGIIAQADDRPRVRVAHVAPGIANVDVYVDDSLSFRDVFYRYISDYIPVTIRGENTGFRARLAGPRSADDPILEDRPTLSPNQDYTFVIAGTLRHVERWALPDNNELPGTGTSRVRIVHASFDTPTAEICLNDVCHTLVFKEDSDYFLMDPGTYHPIVRLNGTEKVFIQVPPLLLQNNGVHTIFLVGQIDGPLGLQLLYTYDAGELADTYPPSDHPFGKVPGGVNPPPAYPPVTGAFLSPRVIWMLGGTILVLAGGIGFWLTRH